jgi:hypothetical protein
MESLTEFKTISTTQATKLLLSERFDTSTSTLLKRIGKKNQYR